MRQYMRVALLVLALVGLAQLALAQTVQPSAPVTTDWKTIVSVLINSVLVLAVVGGINAFKPIIRERYPWVIPIMATVAGPLVGIAQTYLATKVGIQADFSPILSALAGAMATAIHQVGAQQPTIAKMMHRPH